ncbi:hypothetical protein [Paraburkholderia madseniana]|uniref:hypothetical protein n=1 Tax=Paraburkholderia madseniana TaxID=2599607 RepID=UPI0035581199
MIDFVRRDGKAAEVLAPDKACAREYLATRATFVADGTDVGLLGVAARELLTIYGRVPDDDRKADKDGCSISG